MTTFVLAHRSTGAEKVAERENLADGWEILSNPDLLNNHTDATIYVAEDWYVGRDGLTYDRFDNAVTAAEARGCTVEHVDGIGATPFN